MLFTTASNSNLNIIQIKSCIKIVYEDFKNETNESRIVISLENNDIKELIKILENYCTQPIKKEDKAYTEEVNTYKDEVERTLFLTGSKGFLKLWLDCYTDKPYDDNWIVLTQKKLACLIGLLYGYKEE